MSEPDSKSDVGKEKDRVSQFIEWGRNHRWIALLLIVGTITIGIAKFTDAVEKIRHFLFPVPHPVSPPATSIRWADAHHRALAALEALEKRGLNSDHGFGSNF